MNTCDCFIGFLCGDEVKMSELEQKVKDIIHFRATLKQAGLSSNSPTNARQVVDGRSNELHRFGYCPYCGNKIKWTTILRNFR